MKINHPKLTDLLQRAYSAERAAAFAYIGHAGSIRDKYIKAAINQIEADEWGHRKEVLAIMQEYEIPVSKYYEVLYYIIGKFISFSCYVIGWFMPYYFAGKLESGNVCEYFVMKQYFNSLDIHKHDLALYDMGMKEKEHEVYYLEAISKSKLLPLFEKVFGWGLTKTLNNVDLGEKASVEKSGKYCKKE